MPEPLDSIPDTLTAALRRQIDENLRRLYQPGPRAGLPDELRAMVEKLRAL